ncbi:hypothetical protein DERP_003697 [Dermatophagoides pteronyssinus]|uniref:Uncharacterized protein n=1 Tax=Dermatophagoides pteronyssinus TaxID=6956 RepID=A0ABQ8JLE2_DERPT|nr:hypothetical protein DERP_003697 [Dermatophagoides pteronyssinus]
MLNGLPDDEIKQEKIKEVTKKYVSWCQKFLTAKTLFEKESNEVITNNKVSATKIYKTEDYKFKDADPLNFPLWYSYVKNEIVENESFSTIEKIIKIKSMLPDDFILIFDHKKPNLDDILQQIQKRYDNEVLIVSSIKSRINNLEILYENSRSTDWNQALMIANAILNLHEQDKVFAAKELSKKTTMNFHNQTNNATMATNDFSSNNQIDHNKKQKIYALLDGCATVSSISQNLANNLKVQTTVEKGIEIHGYGNNQTEILEINVYSF